MLEEPAAGPGPRPNPPRTDGPMPGGDPSAAGTAPREAARPRGRRPKAGPDHNPAAELGEARLVERAREGDDDAFAVLVTRYERKLVRVLTRLVRDDELGRDLAQETFWRVYSRLDRFDTARRFGPGLFRVGVNLGLDWLRRNAGAAASPVSIDRPGAGGLTFDLADPDPRLRADLTQEVQFVIERIPATYRTILVLRDLEGFSSAEVASIVDRREATVRWRLARAREMFRDHWERRHGTGPSSPMAPGNGGGDRS